MIRGSIPGPVLFSFLIHLVSFFNLSFILPILCLKVKIKISFSKEIRSWFIPSVCIFDLLIICFTGMCTFTVLRIHSYMSPLSRDLTERYISLICRSANVGDCFNLASEKIPKIKTKPSFSISL
jgi:hypothetical protein